jgi:hypothetical protein
MFRASGCGSEHVFELRSRFPTQGSVRASVFQLFALEGKLLAFVLERGKGFDVGDDVVDDFGAGHFKGDFESAAIEEMDEGVLDT